MQPLIWYVRRLRGMSVDEIAWRIRAMMRDTGDRARFAAGLIPDPVIAQAEPGFRVTDLKPGEWKATANAQEGAWRDAVVLASKELLHHSFSFFDLVRRNLGNPIDWNRDHSSGKAAPRAYSQSIDYRDFQSTGDCKLVWEPNRHHQLVVLARAYRATGERQYAEAVVAQLQSWLDQNPFGRGMNWRSPLELGVRVINWVWALDLTRESGVVAAEFSDRLLKSVYLHCREISRKYSRGSSANNHLVGEAAGVYIASSYFTALPGAAEMRQKSREILVREIEAQSYPDGCTREQALGYQFFVLQFYLLAGLVGNWTGKPFPGAYWKRLEKMVEFLGYVSEGGLPMPLFGDCDDGYVLDLGGEKHDPGSLLCIAAVIFTRPEFAGMAGHYREPARWLLQRNDWGKFDDLAPQFAERSLRSRAFPDSGYYLLQHGFSGSRSAISVMFDCGELGMGPIAAHGHADALSVTLRAFGKDILVDTGTYDYFTYPTLRNYFRSTRAHNCVVVDGMDQSVMHGPFMWGARANVHCSRWMPDEGGGVVAGWHDGYARLPDSVTHFRSVSLEAVRRLVTIEDRLDMVGTHEVALYFHFGEGCEVAVGECGRVEVKVGSNHVVIKTDRSLEARVLRGVEKSDVIGGWLSRGYHRKTACDTLVLHGTYSGTTTLVTELYFGENRDEIGAARDRFESRNHTELN